MMRGASYLARSSAMVLALAAGAWVLGAHAQVADADGGARLDGGIDLRLVLDDGTPEFRTGFDLALISATRTQRLSFSGDFGITVPLEDIKTTDLSDPRYALNYLRDTGRSRVGIGAFLQRSALDRLTRLEPDPEAPFDEDDLTLTNDGTRERYGANAGVEWGLNDPVGGSLSYSFSETRYEDTTDPDLLDQQRQSAAAGLRWDASRNWQLTLDGSWQLSEEGDTVTTGETRETTRLGLGTTWQAMPDISIDGSVTQTRIDTETTVLGVTTRSVREGVDLALGMSMDRPNGGYRYDISRILNTPGYVTRISVSRSLALPRGTDLSATIGLAELPSGNVYGTGGITYGSETPRGALSASFDYDVAVNSDDDEVQRAILRAGYRSDLAHGARWSLSGQLTHSTYVMGTEPDIASARLSLDYSRPLTEDWDLSTGVTWRATREDGADQTEESTLFLSLERRFTFRR